MTDAERSIYESAIRAKEQAIRALIIENLRLRRKLAEARQPELPQIGVGDVSRN